MRPLTEAPREVGELSPDTTVVLLLCGRFGKDASIEPLKSGEYAQLIEWLAGQGKRPGDLLDPREGLVEHAAESGLQRERLRALLQRGLALGLAVERWTRSGLWVLSRSDDGYPRRLTERLGARAPALLYGAGEVALLGRGGLAVVGSRRASPEALRLTRAAGDACAKEGVDVISGGARGIDSTAMQAVLESGGSAVGVLAESLLQAVRRREDREGVEQGRLALVSAQDPDAGFTVASAMGRNKHIYALADHALVVQADLNAGGTWAGAVENIRHRWVPVFVSTSVASPGGQALIKLGAKPFDHDPSKGGSLTEYLRGGRAAVETPPPASSEKEAQQVNERAPRYELSGPGTGSRPDPPTSLYEEFLRRLSGLLGQGRRLSQKEIASELGLVASQAKAWLARAEKEQAITGRGRAKRYELVVPGLF